jgi:hypothetical protein
MSDQTAAIAALEEFADIWYVLLVPFKSDLDEMCKHNPDRLQLPVFPLDRQWKWRCRDYQASPLVGAIPEAEEAETKRKRT